PLGMMSPPKRPECAPCDLIDSSFLQKLINKRGRSLSYVEVSGVFVLYALKKIAFLNAYWPSPDLDALGQHLESKIQAFQRLCRHCGKFRKPASTSSQILPTSLSSISHARTTRCTMFFCVRDECEASQGSAVSELTKVLVGGSS